MEKFPKLREIRIKTLKEFSLRLGIKLKILQNVADHIDLHYHKFPKKIGKKNRMLYEADHSLGEIQKRIDENILDRFDYPESLQGGIKGRSLYSNAVPHTRKKNVAHFDIQNFFPSVKPSRVSKVLIQLGCSPAVAHLFVKLVTTDDHLPQGFATSTKISALILLSADARLKKFFKPYGVTPSIWIDDLAVSGSYPIKKLSSGIRKIIKQEGFQTHKETFTYSNERQIVTGTVVNTKPSIPKEDRNDVENIIFMCGRLGVEMYVEKYAPHMTVDKFIARMNGKLGHMIAIDKMKYRVLQEKWKKAITSA